LEANWREVIGGDGSYELREYPVHYKKIFGYENGLEGIKMFIFGKIMFENQYNGEVRQAL
jgi:hypothetical protein